MQGPSQLFGEDSEDDSTTSRKSMHAQAGAHGDATEAGQTVSSAAQADGGDLPKLPSASNGADRMAGGNAEPRAGDSRQRQHFALDIEYAGPRAEANGYTSGRTESTQPPGYGPGER